MLDRDLFDVMANAIAGLPMPLTSHQQAQNIISNVLREVQTRAEARAKKPSAQDMAHQDMAHLHAA